MLRPTIDPSSAGFFSRARMAAVAICAAGTLLGLAAADDALAQGRPAILIDGNAVVTGFSGTQPPLQNLTGPGAADQATIDLNGPAARIADLQSPGAPRRRNC